MNTHDIELPERWQAFQYNEAWGAWEQVIPSAADDPGVVKAYTEDQVRAAIEADRKRRDNDQQPFGYFRPEPFGWTDCAATDEGAIALYERPQVRGEPVAWLYEDELPDNYPYEAMFPYSKVDGVRMFPVYAPQPAEPVAYLDLGVGGYMDVGTALTDEQLAALPKGRHMLGIIGTYGVNGYREAAPQPAEPVKSHLKVSYDDKGDCLYVNCDSNEPAEAEENEQGVLLRRAFSDGRLVGVTILNFMGRHAEPVKVPSDDLAHEIWAAAQTAPGEGIEGAVERVAALLARYGKGTP